MDKPIISGDTIIIPSSQENLADVDLFIEGTLRGYGVQESIIADIAISVSELVNNAILHGNKSSPDKAVTVSIARVNGSVQITVKDQGIGFNPEKVANPIEDANLLKEVGRGIFIVRSLMDSVEITGSSEGTVVCITKAI
ncbi:MAG TPA: ATP-binding protein [Candidatus Acidoferrum sp.]|nr:ATP-binding protein [Candidatus Acidoferrum sp.]